MPPVQEGITPAPEGARQSPWGAPPVQRDRCHPPRDGLHPHSIPSTIFSVSSGQLGNRTSPGVKGLALRLKPAPTSAAAFPWGLRNQREGFADPVDVRLIWKDRFVHAKKAGLSQKFL
jgi:hypothetical protein